jgi:methylenetetrahydrofolate reductase (NADPH)
MLPWCELALANESARIADRLALLNSRGMLTINSQPAVDGAPSTDPDVGWGGPGGLVYQKAYVEMFVSTRTLDALIAAMDSLGPTRLSYQAIDVRGACRHNLPSSDDLEGAAAAPPTASEGAEGGGATRGQQTIPACVSAVTWGVFPAKEIMQPTVVDSEAFVQWSAEAFELWRSQWAALYEPASKSRAVLGRVYSEWWLLNVVDHDFKAGDLFGVFAEVAEALGPDGAEDLR